MPLHVYIINNYEARRQNAIKTLRNWENRCSYVARYVSCYLEESPPLVSHPQLGWTKEILQTARHVVSCKISNILSRVYYFSLFI